MGRNWASSQHVSVTAFLLVTHRIRSLASVQITGSSAVFTFTR